MTKKLSSVGKNLVGTFVLAVLALVVSAGSSKAQVKAQNAKGTAEVALTQTKGSDPILYIQGDAANLLYDELKVEAIPVGEMNEYRLKMGKNFSCLAMYSTVICTFHFSNISQGEIRSLLESKMIQ